MSVAKIEPEKLRIISLQQDLVRDEEFFLAGGTALGIRLGHRFSDDLDWFTAKRFDAGALARRLSSLPERPSKLEQQGPHTLRAFYGTLETSFIRYAQVPAKPELVRVGEVRVPIADLELASAMKAGAVYNRGSKRDFIDIHAIAKLPGWSIGAFIDRTCARLPIPAEQLARALTYFDDAEKQPMPNGCVVKWATVKRDLIAGVREWQRQRSRDLDR